MELTRKLRGPEFEKLAAKFILGDNPSTYPSELIAHLYKQHPYLGKYQVNISIQGQDDSQGYLYGVFLVSQPSDVPAPDGTQQMGQVINQGQPAPDKENSVRVPIIVENKKAYSYDVFITPDGRFLPLNEMRVAAAMFDAGPYAVAPMPKNLSGGSGAMPAEPSGMHGGGSQLGPNQVEKRASALSAANLDKDTVETFLNQVAANERLLDAADLNPAFSSSLSKIAHLVDNHQPVTAASDSPDFDAAIVTKVGGGYVIKTASANGFAVEEHFIRNVDGHTLPRDVRNALSTQSAVLLSSNNTKLGSVETTTGLTDIADTGIFSVLDKHGNAHRAAVISDVVTLDGRSSDLKLVVGPKGSSVQDKVAGVRCGDLDLESLAGSDPLGEGVFVYKTAGAVSEPLDIKHAVFDVKTGDTSYIYESPLRGKGSIKLANVRKPVQTKGNDFLIPEDSAFVPMQFNAKFQSDTVLIEKVAARTSYINKVKVTSDGREYSFEGAPVNELEKKAFLDRDSALLVMGVLGDSPEGALSKLAEASEKGESTFVASSRVTKTETPEVVTTEEAKVASVIKLNLVKEAAVLNNSETVDSVLSLNFITPENVQGYLDALPIFEESASKLAELLVGVRLGLSDIPEPAVASSLSGIERAITGLKKLQIRASSM